MLAGLVGSALWSPQWYRGTDAAALAPSNPLSGFGMSQLWDVPLLSVRFLQAGNRVGAFRLRISPLVLFHSKTPVLSTRSLA